MLLIFLPGYTVLFVISTRTVKEKRAQNILAMNSTVEMCGFADTLRGAAREEKRMPIVVECVFFNLADVDNLIGKMCSLHGAVNKLTNLATNKINFHPIGYGKTKYRRTRLEVKTQETDRQRSSSDGLLVLSECVRWSDKHVAFRGLRIVGCTVTRQTRCANRGDRRCVDQSSLRRIVRRCLSGHGGYLWRHR